MPPEPSPAPTVPVEAGIVNGTSVRFDATGIGNATVRLVTFNSAQKQKCEATYDTEGNVTKPSVVGWVISYSASRTWYAHEFIREDNANVAVAGIVQPTPVGVFPRFVHGKSHSTITLDAGQDMTYYVATNYENRPENDLGGKFSFQLVCPGGMNDLRTAWSTTAYLLSELSLNGTWASVYLELPNGQTARWGATPAAEWSGRLPMNATTFIATEPIAGQAVLAAPSGSFTCGPSMNPQAVNGDALCMHDDDGGDSNIQIHQAAPGHVGQSGTSDSWLALIAQFESHSWAESGSTGAAL
ncbi:MAG: hypothetical protein V4510_02960 [bacterium]